MLNITHAQHDALAAESLRRFKADAVAHVRRNAPDLFARVGALKVDALVADAVDRASTYGLTDSRSLLLFVNMSCLLGSEFDVDPSRPWIPALLRDETRPAAERMPEVEAKVYAEFGLDAEPA